MSSVDDTVFKNHKSVVTENHIGTEDYHGYAVQAIEKTTKGFVTFLLVVGKIEPTIHKEQIRYITFENGDVLKWNDQYEDFTYGFTSLNGENRAYKYGGGFSYSTISNIRKYLVSHPEFVKILDKNAWSLFSSLISEGDAEKLKEIAGQTYDERSFTEQIEELVRKEREFYKNSVERPTSVICNFE